jgi:UV DNA damage endonuclease
MIRWMGYGQRFQDFKCNVHIAGRRGAQGIIDVYPKLSVEARNSITIENEEMKHGLDDCLVLSDHGIPIVLDVHHHFVREGEYINAMDSRIQRILDAWRGVRPVVHYSISREDYLVDHDVEVKPDYNLLLEQGYKKSKMRAHSDFMWNTAVNEWAYQHWQWADIMVEAKGKNLASFKLYEFWKSLEN